MPVQSGYTMQEELKHVLRQRERRNDLDIHKTLTIYINQTSSTAQSANTIECLKGFNAEELFALSRENILEICGNKDGKRLASQLSLQKSVSGYKTARSAELYSLLAKARPKSEMNT